MFYENLPAVVTIIDAKRTEIPNASIPHPQWNPYLYTVEVSHGSFCWKIKKRYNHFLTVHKAILFSVDYEKDSDAIQSPEMSMKNREFSSRKSQRILQRLKSVTINRKKAHFPKRPDFLISEDEVEDRRITLEKYLNSILECQSYRNLPETVSISYQFRKAYLR